MSIEKKKPTKEFYSALDKVASHIDNAGKQLKSSREAYDEAVKIARNQGFGDPEIFLLVKDYLKDKIKKTTLWRYLNELKPIVPMEQINHNNVLEQKDTLKEVTQHSNADMETLQPEELKKVIRYHRTMKLKAQDIANAKGIKLMDSVEDSPGFLIQKALHDVVNESDNVADQMSDLVDNWNSKYKMDERLSKMKPEERKEFTLFIRAHTLVLDFMNDLLASCTDYRYSFSLWKWAEIWAYAEGNGIGAAISKYQVEIIGEDGKPVINPKTGLPQTRKVTRKEFKTNEPKVREFMKKAVIGMKCYAYILGMVELEDIRVELTEYLDQRDIERYGHTLKEISRPFRS